jgi:signal transduction histidine kinase
MSGAVIFSRRLRGATAICIYLGLVVGFAPTVLRHHQIDGTPQGMRAMIALLLTYGLSVTLGWRWVMARGLPRLVYGYFAALTALAIAMFWLENSDTGTGAGVGNLFVVLLLQSGVLAPAPKLAVYFAQAAAMSGISALFMPPESVVLPSLLVILTNGAVTLIGHLIVRDEQTERALAAANSKLRAYAEQVEALATTRERNRLARDIHDSLGHYLTVVNMQIEASLAVLDSDPDRAREALLKAQALTKEGLGEIRRSVGALRAEATEPGQLHQALLKLADDHRASGLEISYALEGQPRPCAAAIEMALYRAAQEGLTNIRKHAAAARAELRLSYQRSDVIMLRLCDDGVGSDYPNTGGFGLRGLRERAGALGGEVVIHTAPGQGFVLSVEIPV